MKALVCDKYTEPSLHILDSRMCLALFSLGWSPNSVFLRITSGGSEGLVKMQPPGPHPHSLTLGLRKLSFKQTPRFSQRSMDSAQQEKH